MTGTSPLQVATSGDRPDRQRGIGAAMVTAATTALTAVTPSEAGTRSGIVNTSRELGGALGVAVLSTVAATDMTGEISTTGVTLAFTAAAVAAAAAVALSTLVVPAGVSSADAPRPVH